MTQPPAQVAVQSRIASNPRRIPAAGLLFTLLLCGMYWLSAGCGKPAPNRDVSRVLAALDTPGRSDSLLRAIPNMLFLKQDLPAIYQALSHSYPDDSLEMGTRHVLLGVLEQVHDESTAGFIEELLPGFAASPPLQLAALRVLAAIHSPASLSILAATLTREPERYPARRCAELWPLIPDSALHSLFPEFLALAHEPAWQLPVYEALAAALMANLSPASLTDSLPVILEQYTDLRQQYRKQEGKRDAVKIELHTCLDLLLQTMAHYPIQPEVNKLLVRGMSDKDPELRLSAAFACFEARIPVSDSVIRSLAADFRVRNPLFLRLNETGHDRRFPADFHTQAAIAQSDLALWLANPENTGRFPEEIHYLKQVSIENDLASGQVYVFRFRYPGDAWRIGISGPQPVDSTEVRIGGYLTGSLYKTDRQIGIDEQVQELMDAP